MGDHPAHTALLDLWARWMRSEGAAPRTITTRLKGIHSLCTHASNGSGPVDPVSLTTIQIVEWLADQRSAWTRRTYASTARAWHQWLADQGVRPDDPTGRLKMPPTPRGLPRPASSNALDAVLETAPRRCRAYILLAAYEGMRVSEVAKIRGEDFDEGWLHIRGKGNRERSVPVHPLVEQLRKGWPTEGYWFPRQYGQADGQDKGLISEHVLPESVSYRISKTFRAAGYDVTAHQLRHWFGTHALRNSHDLRVVQELMGHASPSTTQAYTEVADRAKQEAVWLLNRNGH